MDRADIKLHHRQGHRQQHKRNGQGQTIGVGEKGAFQLSQHPSHKGSQQQRTQDLDQRFHRNGNNIRMSADKGGCNAEGNGKYRQTHSIIQRYHRQQDIRQFASGLILPDDHQSGRRSSSRSNGAQCDGRRDAESIGHEKMQSNECCIYQQCCRDALHNAHHDRLLSNGF